LSTKQVWRRFEVALTGPFFTGQPLRVSIGNYSKLQRRLGDELGSTEGWDHEGIKWRGVESYGSGGGYTSLVPRVLIRRLGEPLAVRLQELQRQRPEAERRWLAEATRGWTWELRELRIELYDFGVGVVNGTYDVSAPAWLSAAATRRTAEAVARLLGDPAVGVRSPVAASYDALTRETVTLFGDAVARCAKAELQESLLDAFNSALPSEPGTEDTAASPAAEGWGRLLWLHPVFVFTSGPGVGARRLRRISRPFEATFSQNIVHWHGVFAPGIDSSVIVLHENIPKQKTPPMGLTELMWAYYALFMEIDRGLLAMLDSDRWEASGSLAELEKDAAEMFSAYMRVQEARARLDSALTDLAGGQVSMWNTIAEVQKFDELAAGVERKIAVLQRIAERRVEQAAATRARLTGNILSGLTALTVVTVVVTLMAYLVGTRADRSGHTELRLVVVALAFALATLILLKVLDVRRGLWARFRPQADRGRRAPRGPGRPRR
jgi:hypothetical protein